ncbi:hypothetical protein Tco_0160274, partial [Tanacetum coccineum]
GQGNDQGMGANGGIEGVNGNVEGANGGTPDFSTIIAQQLQNLLPSMLAQENVGNVIVNGNQVGCSYKEFLACNPKEYDGKGGANHAMVGAGHAAYTDRFHELARLVPHLVTLENKRIKRYVYGLALQIYGMVVATEPTMI